VIILRNMRIRLAGLVAAIVLSGVGVSLPSAHAAVVSPSPGCNALNDPSKDGRYLLGDISLSGSFLSPGETIRFQVTGATAGLNEMTVSIFRDMGGGIQQVMVNLVSAVPIPGTVTYVVPDTFPFPPSSIGWGLSPATGGSEADWVVECIPFTESSTESQKSFPEHLQQVGRGAGSDCSDIHSVDLNWGQNIVGGWGLSWAQWVNGGNGGAVCTRMIYFNSSNQMWAART